MRSVLLALTALAILGCPSFPGEEPATQPVLAPPAQSLEDQAQWGREREFWFSGHEILMVQLALVLLGSFIAGLWRRRYDWHPLVIGLFILGLGALDTTWLLIDGCSVIAQCGRWNLADWCELLSVALRGIFGGLIAVLAGGVFTVVLRWRNAATPCAKTGGDENDRHDVAAS